MENSLLIGSILGPVMFTIGLGLLISTNFYKKMITTFLQEPFSLFIAGIAGVVSGLLIIYYHNIWNMTWISIISLLGWIIFIKSALLIILPTLFEKIMKKIYFGDGLIQFAGVIYGLLGIFLIFKTLM